MVQKNDKISPIKKKTAKNLKIQKKQQEKKRQKCDLKKTANKKNGKNRTCPNIQKKTAKRKRQKYDH